MRKLILALGLIALQSIVFSVLLGWYSNQYIHAYNACKAVAEYCDSTADTGEMDEFIQSSHGQYFWKEWTKVNKNQ